MTRQFRSIPQGHRIVMGLLVPRGWPLEELIDGQWVLSAILPPGREAADQVVASVGGEIKY